MSKLSLLINQYLEYCVYRKKLNPKTLKAYSIDLAQYQEYSGAQFSLKSKSLRKSLDFYITKLHMEYAPKTVKRKIASLKAFFHYLVYIEVLQDSPFNKIDIFFREPKLLPKTLTLHTIQIFLSTIYNQESSLKTKYQHNCLIRDIAVCELLFASGMRVSELCALSPADLDLVNGNVKIWGKGAKERFIQISHPDVLDALIRYKNTFQNEINLSGYFFVNRLHKRLSDQSVRFMINKYTTLAHIPAHITPHMFRHSLATLLLEQDVDIRYIQKILGHSSITTTEIYTHVSTRKQKDILTNHHPRNYMAVNKG